MPSATACHGAEQPFIHVYARNGPGGVWFWCMQIADRHPFAATLLAPLLLTGVTTAQNVGHVWERLADAPVPRFEGPTIPIDGRLYVFGGFFNPAIQVTSRVDVYDPQTDSWSRVADLPIPVTHAPFVQQGRKLWMLGGFVGNNPGIATTDVWIYDIDLDSWTQGPALPRPISAGGAGIVGNFLHYFGGVEIDRNTNTGDHWVLDLNVPQAGWVAAAPLPEPRCHFSSVQVNGLLYAVGGQYRHDNNPEDQTFMHVYDPSLGSWSIAPSLPATRSHAEPGTYVANGRIHVSGGKSSTQQQYSLSDVLIFDVATQQWSFGVPLPIPRYGVGVQEMGDYVYFTTGATAASEPMVATFRRHKSSLMPNPIRINAGGDEYTSPFDGRVWTGDFLTPEGDLHAFPGQPVLGTNDPDLFRFQRRGALGSPQNLHYRLPSGPGFYRCRCYFADLDNVSPGQRIFDLRIEGELVADDVDSVAQFGAGVAFHRAFDVEVTDDDLDVQFQSFVDVPSIAALELEALPAGHFARECTANPNSSGAAGRLDFIGSTSLADDRLLLIARNLPNNTFCVFFQGTTPIQASIPGGILCIGQPLYRHLPVQANGSSASFLLVPSAPPTPAATITAGSTWRFQGWFRDGGTSPMWGFTDSLKFQFTP